MNFLHFEAALLPTGWADDICIGISGGVIASVEQRQAGPHTPVHGFAVPGLCNVHSHAFQRGMAGCSEIRGPGRDDFWSWRQVMYRFLDRLEPDAIAAIAAMAYVEMLETGYTRVGEFHYLHHDPRGLPYANIAETAHSIASAAEITGIGLTLLPVFYAHADFGGTPPVDGQRRFISSVDMFADLFDASKKALTGDANIGVAPHSLRAVTPEELYAVQALCPDGPVHMHAAEQTKEVDACLAWSGARPVQWLLANTDIDRRWCLIHATHLTSDECDGFAKSGAVAGLCPVTEANLGDGIFPAERYLQASGRIATGTDSNILIDAAAELRAIEYSQRLSARSRNMLATAAQPSVGGYLFNQALSGGARALGVEGGIAVGLSADIVELNALHPSLVEKRNDMILDSWIFAGRPGSIKSTWRRGKKVVENSRHIASDDVTKAYLNVIRGLMHDA
jgi:formimidoylglutamate deiminase